MMALLIVVAGAIADMDGTAAAVVVTSDETVESRSLSGNNKDRLRLKRFIHLSS